MPTEITFDVRMGVVIINSPTTGQRKVFPRDETGHVTITVPDALDGIRNDHPDAEKADAPWEPLHPAVAADPDRVPVQIRETNEAIWKNNLYTVIRSEWRYPAHAEDPDAPTLVHLSIRRNDRLPVTDWRHKQKIKNQLAGEDCEAVELYPAEDRLVDTSNQFHLWCFPPGVRVPVGYEDGRVTFGQPALDGAKQRPFVDGEVETVTAEKLEEMAEAYRKAPKRERNETLDAARKRAQELAQ